MGTGILANLFITVGGMRLLGAVMLVLGWLMLVTLPVGAVLGVVGLVLWRPAGRGSGNR